MSQSLNSQMRIISENMQRYLRAFQDSEKRKQILEYAAKPIIQAAQQKAPKGAAVHYRYAKQSRRSPKGSGRIVATYHPGNLKGSVQILKKLRRSKNVYVGPVVRKGKVFGKSISDGYYAHMVEYGTSNQSAQPFMRPAYESARGAVLRRLELAIMQLHNKSIPKK